MESNNSKLLFADVPGFSPVFTRPDDEAVLHRQIGEEMRRMVNEAVSGGRTRLSWAMPGDYDVVIEVKRVRRVDDGEPQQ